MRPYKVIHVITRLDRGGSAQNTLLTAMGHDRSRFEPVVVAGMPGCRDAQGGMPATEENCRRLDKTGVRWHLVSSLRRRLNPVRDLLALWNLLALLRRERPDIVHTHTSKAGMLGRLAAWLAGVPVVVHTPHGHVFYGHFGRVASWAFRRMEKAFAARTTRLIALTEAERDEHLKCRVGRPEQFAVVPSGVDLERFRRVAAAALTADRRPPGFDLPPDAVVVGSVGWLTTVKGHRYLIEALGRLRPFHSRLYCVIVGAGELLDELQALAAARGLSDSVRFLGLRHDVPECLAAMDVFVLPSLNEGMGRALVEAMAAGRPVVATRVGGVPALIQHQSNGLLVPPGNAVALANALDELLRKPDWAQELGAAASASIDDRFGAGEMVQAVDAVYEESLAGLGSTRQSSASRRALVTGLWTGLVLSALVAMSVPAFAENAQGIPPVEPRAAGLRPLVATVHVHSHVSTGSLSLDQLAERAEQLGIEAVVLTDNFVLRYEYGLPPLRGVLKRTYTLPSVLEYGVQRFLQEVTTAQARHPRVLLVPGVEVAPHYYWTGSLTGGNLTMHNSQKNLLVLGLRSAEEYASLPVSGNPGSYRYGWMSGLNLSPVLLLVPAAWLWRRPVLRQARVGVTMYTVEKRRRLPALVLSVVALVLLLNAWPFGQPVFSAYDDRLEYQPYQALIDAVAARGGVVLWSMPEAIDFNVFSFGPLGKVTVKTDRYPEALMLTKGYTGFGGVYQDTRTVTQPGGIWDQVLGLYLTGQRAVPPFITGEIAFHGPGHDTLELDQVLTVLRVRERTPEGLADAVRSGRLYGVVQTRKDFGLRLDLFRVECEGGARGAESGETLDPEGARDVAVQVAVSATDQGRHPVSVTIVRSGEVVARLSGETPFQRRFTDDGLPPGRWHAYRVEVRGDGEILSNPIFVGPVPGHLH